MSPDPTISLERTFLSVAGELGFLSAAIIADLAAAARAQNTSPAALALQRGLLDGTQLDIVETLLHPREAVPGYEILGLLGRGGMGVVYRARQLSLARIVALKTVLVSELGQEAAVPRFEQEARAVARLAHPHIIAAYDFGAHHGRVYFAMELVPGEDVERLVERTGALDEFTAWGLARQAAAGLAHAAAQGIVHRDIKPANLLLLEPPAGFDLAPGLPLLKIADFGLARLTTAGSDRARMTASNVAVGSPRYMSPEQFRGQASDHRADIFSLGASVFHMLSGRPPLGDKSLPEIVAARLEGVSEQARFYAPTVSAESDELIAAMTASDPDMRIADYTELVRRIDALRPYSRQTSETHIRVTQKMPVGNATTRTGTEPTQAIAQQRPQRNWFPWFVGLLVAALLALLALPFVFTGNAAGERDLVPTGKAVELFNGQNVQAWQIYNGGWSPARNEERAIVLQGSGLIGHGLALPNAEGQLEPLSHYRLTFVVDLHQATGAGLFFDFSETNADNNDWIVHLDGQSSTLLEQRNNMQAPPVRAGPKAYASAEKSLHSVRLERHSRGWWVFVDESLLGSVPLLHENPAAEIRLFADGGKAWFSDLTCEELAPPAVPDPR